MNYPKQFLLGLSVYFFSTFASAEITRYDLSPVTVRVEYSINKNGQWEYRYSVTNDSQHRLSQFLLDLVCEHSQSIADDEVPAPQGEGFIDLAKYPEIELLRKGVHVPATLSAAYGAAAFWGISVNNEAFWYMKTAPGSISEGLLLVSKGQPTMRKYTITPYFELDMSREDGAPEADEENSYALYGLIIGPSCEESTDVPPEEPNNPVFEGTPPGAFGLYGVNHVLTYATPTQSQLSVPANQTDIALTVHYAGDMDPASFKVEPGWTRELFNPVPGSSETVMLPLKPGLNRFRLEANLMDNETRAVRRPTHDLDVFAIRRGKTPPGQAKKQ